MTHDLEILDVPNDAVMLRRIPCWQYDAETGSIHSKAFANDKDKIDRTPTNSHSVNWEELTSVEATLVGHEGFGVASLPASAYKQLCQEIKHSPECDNYGHCDAEGKKTARILKALKKQATLRVAPKDCRSTT